MIKIGPAGFHNGEPWDERGRTEIVQIFVSHGDQINTLQFQYADNGILSTSQQYGETTGPKYDVLRFNYPSEYLICITGHTKNTGNAGVTSLAFATNQRTYGPFGRPTNQGNESKIGGFATNQRTYAGIEDYEFRFQLGNERQFGGFHGRSDGMLRSIGVYLMPITTLENANTS